MIVDVGSFKGSNIVVLDLTGQLSAGSNVLMVQAAGMPGASLSYELTSQSAAAGTVGPLKLSSVDPPEVPPGGTITVKGTGFVEDSSKDIVSIYNKPCPVSKATATTLDVKTPAGLDHIHTASMSPSMVSRAIRCLSPSPAFRNWGAARWHR